MVLVGVLPEFNEGVEIKLNDRIYIGKKTVRHVRQRTYKWKLFVRTKRFFIAEWVASGVTREKRLKGSVGDRTRKETVSSIRWIDESKKLVINYP